MIVELISTGSELLLGDTVNTNVSWLAQELNKLGYTIAHQSVVGDNPKRMAEVFQLASTRADIVISTGGLGPTQGDITRNVLADSIGRPIVFNQEAMDEVKKFFDRVKRTVPDASRREAELPEGANVLHNPVCCRRRWGHYIYTFTWTSWRNEGDVPRGRSTLFR